MAKSRLYFLCFLSLMGLAAVLLFPEMDTAREQAQAQTAGFSVSCFGEAGTRDAVIAGLCDTLKAELSERVSESQGLRQAQSSDADARTQTVVLQVTRTEDHLWQAHLVRETDQPEPLTGPAVELTGMDKTLGPGDYRQFIQGLLKVSNFTF